MARFADMKMALLAVLIVLTTVICARDEDRLVENEPVFMHAPTIQTQVLAG